MRKSILSIALIILFGLWLPALEVPDATGYVSDYAGLLTSAEAQTLDQKLRTYDQQTANQIVVLIIKSLEGESRESFAIKVMDKWKPGQKSKDNGVIFIIAKEDRATRIEVGYGLEPSLTDLECALILENIVKPNFRANKYYEGINEAIDAIFKSISEDFNPNNTVKNNTGSSQVKNEGTPFAIIIIILMLLIPFIIIWKNHPSISGKHSEWWSASGRYTGRGGSGGFGGGFGGGGGFSGGGGRGGGGGASGGW